DLVVCDLAGTTVRDGGEVPAAFEDAAPLSLPGVHETFERLKAGGIGVAVTTGFDREVVEAVLAGVSWAGLLDAWICGGDVPRGRPAPFMIFRAMERCGA